MEHCTSGTLNFSGLINPEKTRYKHILSKYNKQIIQNKHHLDVINKSISYCINNLKNKNLRESTIILLKDVLRKSNELKKSVQLNLEEINSEKEIIEKEYKKIIEVYEEVKKIKDVADFIKNECVNNEYYINRKIPTNLQIENIKCSSILKLFLLDTFYNIFSDMIYYLHTNYKKYLSEKKDIDKKVKGGIFNFPLENSVYISSKTLEDVTIQGKIGSIEYYYFEGNPLANKIIFRLSNQNLKKITSKESDYFSIRIINREDKCVGRFNCDYDKGKGYMSDLKYISIIDNSKQERTSH
jgi:hypothetical protein